MPSGNIVLYAKGAVFEFDAEDGTIHTVIRAHGMEVRIIQNAHYFAETGVNAEAMRAALAAQVGKVVELQQPNRIIVRGESI